MADRKKYWQDVADQELTIQAEWPVVVSLSGSEIGGREGSIAEVDPPTAARLIVDRTHRLATDAEVEAWRAERLRARDQAKKQEAARQLQLAVIQQNLLALSQVPVPTPVQGEAGEAEQQPPPPAKKK